MPDHADVDALRLPPHSLEAEQSVLGGLMLDNDAADRVGDVLTAGDFYSEAHRLIYEHAAKLIGEAKPADAVTLAESLASSGKLEHVGGLAYIGRARAERADRGEHPPLRADRARPLGAAPARVDRGRRSPNRRTSRWDATLRSCSTKPRPR
jgi:hypothetical protein